MLIGAIRNILWQSGNRQKKDIILHRYWRTDKPMTRARQCINGASLKIQDHCELLMASIEWFGSSKSWLYGLLTQQFNALFVNLSNSCSRRACRLRKLHQLFLMETKRSFNEFLQAGFIFFLRAF